MRGFDIPGCKPFKLKDEAVISFIASIAGLDAKRVRAMLFLDLEALEPTLSGMFIDEFKPPESIVLVNKPKQFCMSCFMNSLLQKKIPIFNPYWQSLWATHCIEHETPLVSVDLLDTYNYQSNGFLYEDGSQYKNWCGRLEGAKKEMLRKQHLTRDIRVGAASKTIIAINKLFNSSKMSKLGVSDLDLKRLLSL